MTTPYHPMGNGTPERFNQMLGTLEDDLGPVVQNIVSLTTSLRRQLVRYMPTKLSNTLLFFVEKM